MNVLLRLSTAVISGLLLWTGVGKLLDWQAFLDALSNYPLLPPSATPALAGVVVASELYVAGSLWLATLRRYALAAAAVMFIVFAAAVGLLYATRGPLPCGCSLTPLASSAGLEHVVLNVLLAALALAVWRADEGSGGGVTTSPGRMWRGVLFQTHPLTNLPEGVFHETPESPTPRGPARLDSRDDCDHRTRSDSGAAGDPV